MSHRNVHVKIEADLVAGMIRRTSTSRLLYLLPEHDKVPSKALFLYLVPEYVLYVWDGNNMYRRQAETETRPPRSPCKQQG